MTPAAVIEGADKLRSDIHQMCQHTVEMLKLTWEGFKTHDVALLRQAAALGQHVHQQEKTLTTLAVQQSGKQGGIRGVVQELLLQPIHLERQRLDQQMHQQETTPPASTVLPARRPEGVQGIFLVPVHLERIGDNIELLGRALTTVIQEGIPFTERANKELNTLFARAIELLECARDVLLTQNRILLRHMQIEGQRYEELVNEYALFHQQRLIEGLCLPKASSLFVALLDYLKGITGHIGQIADKLAHESVA
jgi:Na+/phosphate symporter